MNNRQRREAKKRLQRLAAVKVAEEQRRSREQLVEESKTTGGATATAAAAAGPTSQTAHVEPSSGTTFPFPPTSASKSQPPQQPQEEGTTIENAHSTAKVATFDSFYSSAYREALVVMLEDRSRRQQLHATTERKYGVEVSSSLDFGYVAVAPDDLLTMHEVVDVAQRKDYVITNHNPYPVILHMVIVLPLGGQFSVLNKSDGQPIHGDSNIQSVISADGGMLAFTVVCNPRPTPGYNHQWVVFGFELPILGNLLEWSSRSFVMARETIVFNTSEQYLDNSLSAEALSFYPSSLKALWDNAGRPFRWGKQPGIVLYRPPVYEIAKPQLKRFHQWYYHERVTTGDDAYMQWLFSRINKPLQRLQYLLNTEHMQRSHTVEDYDLFHVPLTSCVGSISFKYDQRHPLFKFRDEISQAWSFECAGAAERRPALDLGDQVRVLFHNAEKYECIGYIFGIRGNSIFVHLDTPRTIVATHNATTDVSVRFRHQSFPFETMMGCLDVVLGAKNGNERGWLSRLWVPPNSPAVYSESERKHVAQSLQKGRSQVPLNATQCEAVAAIASYLPNQAPFVLFGPPGTGKTSTLCEAILRLVDTHPQKTGKRPTFSVLVCCPSDYSADVIASRLLPSFPPSALIRINSTRRYTPMPRGLAEYAVLACDYKQDPARHRVVISTCLTAAEFSTTHPFTHLVIDESCQALEPELYVPLIKVHPTQSVVVLAGDHLQLGPVLHSMVASKLGLGRALQHRFMSHPFVLDPQNKYYVQLTCNYRSHAAILSITNRLFYGGVLTACAKPSITDQCLRWNGLRNNKFPLLFIGNEDEDTYHPESSSFFNEVEAKRVVELVMRLLSSPNGIAHPLQPDNIAVIAPYFRQVALLRVLFRANNLAGVQVGVVENFQGKEERVVILSTVVSKARPFLSDKAHVDDPRVGVFRNNNRFNVATSRAQSLLVVFGNPLLLVDNPRWKEFIDICYRNNAYQGIQLPILNPFIPQQQQQQPKQQHQQQQWQQRQQHIHRNHHIPNSLLSFLDDDEEEQGGEDAARMRMGEESVPTLGRGYQDAFFSESLM